MDSLLFCCRYHNTQEIFGFQYVPLSLIDECVHGSSVSPRALQRRFAADPLLFPSVSQKAMAAECFRISCRVLEKILADAERAIGDDTCDKMLSLQAFKLNDRRFALLRVCSSVKVVTCVRPCSCLRVKVDKVKYYTSPGGDAGTLKVSTVPHTTSVRS